MVKILDLNIWNYNNFRKRKPKITALIKRHNPDIVTLQEVTDDLKYNKKGENQVKQINKKLGYPYLAFYFPSNMQKESPNKYGDREVMLGNAILSKYPILKVTKKRLKKQKDDKHHRGILHVRIKAETILDVIIVHFSNRDRLSYLHLIETLDYAKNKKINPIIIGDFNMRHPSVLVKSTKARYRNSYTYKKYISFPGTRETLDYILIPKNFKFESLKCIKDNVSDHRALVVVIT